MAAEPVGDARDVVRCTVVGVALERVVAARVGVAFGFHVVVARVLVR